MLWQMLGQFWQLAQSKVLQTLQLNNHNIVIQAVRQDVKEFVQLRRQTSKDGTHDMHVQGATACTAEPAAPLQDAKAIRTALEQQVQKVPVLLQLL